MQHHFDVDLAVKYGVVEAILLNHFEYWIELNKANGKNFYDGLYWTFNSMKAFCEIFPYLSEKKIRNALKNLQSEGLIVTGNYNRLAYDRTLWYALTEKAESILTKGQMEINERANGDTQKGEPIPDNNPDNNPYISSTAGNARAQGKREKEPAPNLYDKSFAECIQCYEGNIGAIPRYVADSIGCWLKTMPADLVCKAITEAAAANKRSWKYAEAILNRCENSNIRSVAAYEADEAAKAQQAIPGSKKSSVEETRAKLRQIAGGGSFDL